MNHLTTFLATCLLLSLLACNISATPIAQAEEPQEASPAKSERVQQAKALGHSTWEKTKQNSKKTGGVIQEKSKEYYEIAKDKAAKTAETVAERSKSYYKTAKEKSHKYLEKATETAENLTETVKDKASKMLNSTEETTNSTI